MFPRLMLAMCLLVLLVGAVPFNRGRQQNRNRQLNRGRSLGRSSGRSFNNNNNNNRGRQLNQGNGRQQQRGYGRQLDAEAAPANNGGGMMPMNYDFQYAVDNEEYMNYYGHKEAAVDGRVDGTYYVWQPDGRLMKVEYYVDGDSGFVPTITYEDAYQPTWGSPYFQ